MFSPEEAARRREALDELRAELLACRACPLAGYPVEGLPVIGGDSAIVERSHRVMLVGQAPGRTEAGNGRPFSGPAGKRLFQWLAEAGIDEASFRAQVHMAAMTRCFPGPSGTGHGDRRPTPHELALCRHFLDRQIELIQPEVVILVGGMAIEALLGKMPLDRAVGRLHERDGVRYLPLPHPSGASTWFNRAEHKALLRRSLDLLRETGLIEPGSE